MKTSKQRKMMRAIINNKALVNSEAKRLTDMQGKVFDNQYKHDRKFWKKFYSDLSNNSSRNI